MTKKQNGTLIPLTTLMERVISVISAISVPLCCPERKRIARP
jgi:hypothetical protein